MTRKHFVELAAAIKALKGLADEPTRKQVAERVADLCAQTNVYFDRGRFLAACGVE